MNRKLQLILAVTWSSTFAVACADREVTAPAVPGGDFTAAITCQATVSTGTLSCGSSPSQAAPGMNFDVIVGGPRGTYVTLASTGTAYNSGTQAFTSNVTVQNHTAQPMATTDGTTPDAGGIKVFVHSVPTATGGFGTITVGNADGSGTFTGSNQPYWQYSGVLAPAATSSSKLWQFNVPNTVTTFSFQVYVDTKLPAEASVLRWVPETSPPTTETLNGVRMQCCNPGTTGWAVGDNGTILHYDGTSWSAVNTNLALSGIDLYGVDAGGGAVVYIVGDGGTIVYSGDGGVNWSLQSPPVTTALFSVSRLGSGSSAVYAVGAGGVILYSADGSTWSQQTSNTTASLFITGGNAANDFFAAGEGGTGLHWDGTSWNALDLNTTATIHSGTGAGDQTGLTDIWLAGTGGTIVHSSNGLSWSVQRSGGEDLFGANGNGPTDQFEVGSSGTILHWNGVSWSAMASGSTANLKAVETSGGGGFVDVWAVGSGGTILHGIR